jgi:hypothetical protein
MHMQQFVRVLEGNVIKPGLACDAGLLDIRSLVSDIHSMAVACAFCLDGPG